MVKKLAMKKIQIRSACNAGIKEESNSKMKTEQQEFGAVDANKVFSINKKRSSPVFQSKFQPKVEENLIKTPLKKESIGLEDLLEFKFVSKKETGSR